MLYCLIGLGNPGKEYLRTRHNAGFLAIDRIAESSSIPVNHRAFNSLLGQGTIGGQKVLLVKPQTFMNLSGEAAGALVRFYKIQPDQLLVIYDDLDLPLGSLRFRMAGSGGGHKGMGSIIQHLNTDAIPRLRMGIGRPGPGMNTVDYVLTPFAETETALLNDITRLAGEAAVSFVTKGPGYVMNHYNITPGSNKINPSEVERKVPGGENKPAEPGNAKM